MKKRILAMFLACMMILSVIAVPAFAAEEEAPCTHPVDKRTYGTILKGDKIPVTCADESVVAEWTCECGHTDVGLVEGKHTTTADYTDATCDAPLTVITACACGKITETKTIGEKLGHDFVLDTNNKDNVIPGCEIEGALVYKCSRCKEEEIRRPAALEHNYVKVEGADGHVPADCKNPAGYKEKCSICQDERVITYPAGHELAQDALGHTEEVIPAVPSDCKNTGWTAGTKCSVCKEVIDEPEETAKDTDNHNFVPSVELKPATCTVAGVALYACSRCGEEDGYKVVPAGHKWVEDKTQYVAPKCGKAGQKVEVCELGCTGDDAKKVTVLKATDKSHTWVTYDNTNNLIDATCTEPAMTASGKFCSACKTKEATFTPVEGYEALGHDMVLDTEHEDYVAPACGVAAVLTYKCARTGCEHRTVENKEAVPHAWKPVKVDAYIEETCEHANGVKQECSACKETRDYYYTLEVEGEKLYKAPLPHTEEEIPAVAATCATKGATAGVKCSVCKKVIVEPQEVEKDSNAHEYEVVTILKAATCDVDGVGEYACKHNCAVDNYYAAIPAAHSWNTESLLVSENSHAIYNPCTKCDAVVVYKYLGDLAEGETEADYNGKIVDSLDLDVTVAITGLVDKNVSLTVNVIGLATGANAWVEVNGNVVEMNGTHATYVARVNNIASTFNVVVKVEEYGVVRTSAVSEYKFAQAESVPTVEVKQTTKLENATAKFFSRGVLIGETVKLVYRVEAAETASVVLVNGDTKYTVNLADLTLDADGKYTVEFEIAADEWTTEFAATIVDADGKAISNTNYYSVAQYAQNNVNTVEEAFKAVLLAMMKAAA